MNARQAAEESHKMTSELLDSAKRLAEEKGISIEDAIDYKVYVYEKYAKNATEATAWYLRGESAKKMIAV